MLPTVTKNQPQFACTDENRHFSTDHLKDDLAGRSARGGAVTAGAQGFKFVLSTVAAIVLARLLTPNDYGLIGMVAILINFVGLFLNVRPVRGFVPLFLDLIIRAALLFNPSVVFEVMHAATIGIA